MGEERSGFNRALDILSRRDQSEAELALKLRRRGIGEDEIESVVNRLRELGYLNDRRLAERIAESALADGRMVGPRLSRELLRRGIPRDLAAEALTRATEGHDPRSAIREMLAGKFPSFDPAVADFREKRRVVGWFQRRGYPLSAILEALRVSADE
ncbi:recombination regulator RecX [Geobacter hydrogenophilus]|uniref:Regulatory protein RecX n=1 Tax=Geobacter hydrogenophilus TaxID=40983 RepID=A0A9W6LCY3_9BACT|nr:regulatory protein RecX [Geobacter hydrogenophilus]MBT0893825.1 recombination regulator RecX [Geobacter hydrogenophilus]GLI38234.1 regulatory protein RecX [Geobacter hydrogenophilus]